MRTATHSLNGTKLAKSRPVTVAFALLSRLFTFVCCLLGLLALWNPSFAQETELITIDSGRIVGLRRARRKTFLPSEEFPTPPHP